MNISIPSLIILDEKVLGTSKEAYIYYENKIDSQFIKQGLNYNERSAIDLSF